MWNSPCLSCLRISRKEQDMQLIMTALAVVAGMAFSLAIAILAEEVVFGKVLKFVFRPVATSKN
jgi:hypothetical protein